MTLDELDRRHTRATWLIRRRAAVAGAKAFVIGRESLAALIDRVADIYELSPADRAALRPDAIDAVDGVGSVVDRIARPAALSDIGAGGVLSLVRRARSTIRVMRAGRTLVTHGAGAAARIARGGKLIGRASPVVTAAWGAYAVGTAGWFLYRANAYNRAAYDLLRARI